MSEPMGVEASSRRIAEEFARMGVERGRGANALPTGKSSFGEVLEGLVNDTDSMQKEASGEMTKLLKGEKDNVNEVLLAVSKADLSFKMMLEVRNKLLEAYQEVMRMQV